MPGCPAATRPAVGTKFQKTGVKAFTVIRLPEMRKADFDVVIAGAGPAGLGCALNFSMRGLRVLLVERGPIGRTEHTWVSFVDVLRDYQLCDAIVQEFARMTDRQYGVTGSFSQAYGMG